MTDCSITYGDDGKNTDGRDEYRYMMLSRLSEEIEYYLNKDSCQYKNDGRLWAGNTKEQFEEIDKLWGELRVKPKWLSLGDIERLKRGVEDLNKIHYNT